MWFNLKSFFLNSPTQSGVSLWMLVGVAVLFAIIGCIMVRSFATRFGKQAEIVVLRNRENQSEFDLANRDITKVRKDLDVELAKHGEYIRRWKRS